MGGYNLRPSLCGILHFKELSPVRQNVFSRLVKTHQVRRVVRATRGRIFLKYGGATGTAQVGEATYQSI